MDSDETWSLFEFEYLPTLEHRARTLAVQSGLDHRLLYDHTRDYMERRWPELSTEPPLQKQLHYAMKVLRTNFMTLLKHRREEPVEDVAARGGDRPSSDWRINPEEAMIRKEEANRIYQLVSRLPEKLLTVYVMRTTMQMQPPEIAESLGITPSSVSSRYCRAVARLKELVLEEGLQ